MLCLLTGCCSGRHLPSSQVVLEPCFACSLAAALVVCGSPLHRSVQLPAMSDDTENIEEPIVVESLLLSVAHHWSRRETFGRQTELLERHFTQEQMYSALEELHKLAELPKTGKRKGGAAKTATLLQAEDVVNAITILGNKDKLPRFVVQSDDLPRVLPLLGALSVGDERAVSARLEALEAAQRQNMVEMRRILTASNQARSGLDSTAGVVATPDITLTPPSFGAAVAREQNSLSYAAMAGGSQSGGGAAGTTPKEFLQRPTRVDQFGRGKMESSLSAKRRRLSQEDNKVENGSQDIDGFRPQGRVRKQRTRPKVYTGSADTEGLADLAGPAEFWIGNTRADSTELKVAEVLNQAGVQNKLEDFKVEKVVCLTKAGESKDKIMESDGFGKVEGRNAEA